MSCILPAPAEPAAGEIAARASTPSGARTTGRRADQPGLGAELGRHHPRRAAKPNAA